MEIEDIVRKLIGPINPIGDSAVDRTRLVNLEVMIMLVDKLLYDISMVSANKDRHEESMRKAGELAVEFIKTVKEA